MKSIHMNAEQHIPGNQQAIHRDMEVVIAMRNVPTAALAIAWAGDFSDPITIADMYSM